MSQNKLIARTLLLLPALYWACATAQAPAGPSVERGKQKVAEVCVACHGADGNSPTPANPVLAGQSEQYIVTQLKAFKKGTRDNAIMKGFATALSDDDMKSVGMYLSRQQARPGVATDKALAQRGQDLYRAGNRKQEVPACAGCHGPAGQGIPAQYPRLAGQPAWYTLQEMQAFKAGTRTNDKGRLMRAVMARITEAVRDNDAVRARLHTLRH